MRWVLGQVVLMIVLRRVKGPVLLDPGYDCGIEHASLVKLGNIGLRGCGLLGAGGENRRAILRAGIGSLPVELRWIVCDGKENLQDLAVTYLLGIKHDAHGLGMSRCSAPDQL